MDTTGLAKDIEMIIKSLDDEIAADKAATSETKANILDVSDENQQASTKLKAFFKQIESEDGAATPNDLEFQLEDLKNFKFRSMEGLEKLDKPQNHEENDIPPMADESKAVVTVAEPEKVEIETVGGSEHNLDDENENNGSILETLRSSGLVQGIISMVEKIGEAEPEDFIEPAAEIVNAEVSSAPKLAPIEIPSIVVTEASSWEPTSRDCVKHPISTVKSACHGGESQQLTKAYATPSQPIPVDIEVVEFCENPSAASSTTSGKKTKRCSLRRCLSRIWSLFKCGSGKN